MKNERVEQIGARTLCEAFEQFAFLFPMPMEQQDLADDPPTTAVHVTMSFEGPNTGRLSMMLGHTASATVAANVLGRDEEDQLVRERAEDACREMLNIISGQFLTRYFGETDVFDLSTPSSTHSDPKEWERMLNDERTTAFLLEDQPLLFQIQLNEPAS